MDYILHNAQTNKYLTIDPALQYCEFLSQVKSEAGKPSTPAKTLAINKIWKRKFGSVNIFKVVNFSNIGT